MYIEDQDYEEMVDNQYSHYDYDRWASRNCENFYEPPETNWYDE